MLQMKSGTPFQVMEAVEKDITILLMQNEDTQNTERHVFQLNL